MPIDPEELLWELSALEEGEDAPIPDDQTLRDYREGRLAAGHAERVERLLARSRRARQRLAVLAALEPARPSSELRSRVLASHPARPRGWSSWQRAALAVAAMVLMIVAIPLFWLDGPAPPPALPEYQIQVLAAAPTRDLQGDSPHQDSDQVIPVDPRTIVRIRLTAIGAASDRVSYGLYRLDDGRLTRLREPQGVELQIGRGAAVFEAAASDLAPRLGRCQLFALVASPGRLPDRLPPQPGERPEALLSKASGGRVFSVQLDVSPNGDLSKEKGKEEE